MGRTKLDETYIFKININSFDVPIDIKILFLRVSANIEPGRCLLTVPYHELFDKLYPTTNKKKKSIIQFSSRENEGNISLWNEQKPKVC